MYVLIYIDKFLKKTKNIIAHKEAWKRNCILNYSYNNNIIYIILQY